MQTSLRTLWFANPLSVWTGNDADAGGGIVIAGDRIVELVPTGQTPKLHIDERFDARGHVLLPGLVNCHHHFYQTLTRVVPSALNRELFGWLTSLYPIWARLDARAVEVATRLALCELALSGCTTTADHHYIFSDALSDAIDVQVSVARELGIRFTATRGSMSVGTSRGGLPPDEVVQTEEQILQDCERVVARHHDPDPAALCQVALAPCSPFSVSAELLRDSALLARKLGVRLHTHLGETFDEQKYCLATYGKRPLAHLAELGWVGPDVWFAHGIHFDEAERALLGASGTGISHCPSSNMILASGICPTLELEAAGAGIGLGVDGSASNCASNLLQETRQALLLQRLRYGAARVTHHDALRWATVGGARILGRQEHLGSLAPGKLADLALFRLDGLRFSSVHDPVAALVLCGADRADAVLVGGRFIVRDGNLVGVDVERLRREHADMAAQLVRAA